MMLTFDQFDVVFSIDPLDSWMVILLQQESPNAKRKDQTQNIYWLRKPQQISKTEVRNSRGRSKGNIVARILIRQPNSSPTNNS